MPEVVVSGTTTPAIHAAIAAAKEYGTVRFPNDGTGALTVYDANLLYASVANQTWIFEEGTKLLRNASATQSAVIEQTHASGFLKIRGGIIDGNRGVNNQPGNGVYSASAGRDLDIEDCTIQNTMDYGVTNQDCILKARRVIFRDTRKDCVFWTNPSYGIRYGVELDKCTFDRGSENPLSVIGGCVKLHGVGLLDARVTRSRFVIQYTDVDNAVLLEAKGCTNLHVTDNTMTGGHTAISVGDGSAGDVITGNICEYQRAYAVEYGGNRGLIASNNILGVVNGTIVGIIGNACTGAKAIGNNIKNCTTKVQTAFGGVMQDIDNT